MSQKSFEDVIDRIKHLKPDEKVAVAKYLAIEQGVRMYTENEVVRMIHMAQAEAIERDRVRRRILEP